LLLPGGRGEEEGGQKGQGSEAYLAEIVDDIVLPLVTAADAE
jgi:hypothetical protein